MDGLPSCSSEPDRARRGRTLGSSTRGAGRAERSCDWSRRNGRVTLVRMAWEIVIAGGGFGGFYAARTLERILPHHSARITLVSEVNYMLYSPLLPGAAAGTLEPRHVVVPL